MAKKENRPIRFPWPSPKARRGTGAGLLAAVLLVSTTGAGAPRAKDKASAGKDRPSKAFKGRLPVTELSEQEAVLHALNRLGYGPRPGEVERVRRSRRRRR